MKRLQVIVALLIGGASVLSGEPAGAQYRPRISPWLELGRRDAGPLGPYLSNVRPRQQLARTLRQQQGAIRQQNAGLRSLGQQFSRFEREGPVRPTGTSSVFMEYSHYYQFGGSSGRRRSVPVRRPSTSARRPSTSMTRPSMPGISRGF